MKVRTLKDHANRHGGSYNKSAANKTEYDIADDREAKRLIKKGLVEEVVAKPAASK